jgi:polysaccharide chain length determinant protein (PEP-CTERM system associated)
MNDQRKTKATYDETGDELQRMFEVGWRRKWVIIIPFLTIFLLVNLWALYQPNLYRSSSSIFIEPQKVPSNFVRSTVTTDIEGRMRSISQQLTSRTKLLKVIERLDLYPDLVAKGKPPEVLVAKMREDLSVENPNLMDANFFTVNYIHTDPNKAMLAVSNLVNLFIMESLQVREDQAKDTTEFIEDELERLKVTLQQQERAVQRYKQQYMGQLPDQLVANLRMLDNLQLQLTSNQESQREMEGRLMLIEQEISRLEGNLDLSKVDSDNEITSVTNATLNQLVQQMDELRKRIANMEAMYTSRHPDLVAARNELARVEERFRAARKNLAENKSKSSASSVDLTPTYSMELTNLRRQVTEIKPRLNSLRQEEKNLRSQINDYQKRVESSPLREQQLTQLTRDYENTKASYEELLTKRTEAQMSENLEKRQQGEKFQILDPANFPEKPYLPNRPKLMGMGFAGGLGAGIGLALLLEALFPAFYSLKQLQNYVTNVPITFGIPHIQSTAEKMKRRRRLAIGLATTLVTLVLVLVLFDHFVVDLDTFFEVIGSNAKEMF